MLALYPAVFEKFGDTTFGTLLSVAQSLSMPDNGERTEKPTKHRLDKARREGQFPASREFLAALQFLTFTIWLSVGGAILLERTRQMGRYFLTAAFHLELTPHIVPRLYWSSMGYLSDRCSGWDCV